MAYGIRNVSKMNPCPICGKPDWCGWMLAVDGEGEELICQRDTEHENALGLDGRFYIFRRLSTNRSNSIFEEAEQRYMKDKKQEEDYKLNKDSFKKREIKRPTYTVVDDIQPKNNSELDKVYRNMLNMLVLDDVHKEYLMNEGWTEELLKKHNVKSFPERDYVRYKYKNNFSKNPYRKRLAKQITGLLGENALLGVPGAYKDSRDNWTFAGPKGILFPLYDANHNIYRLRIRMDFLDVPKEFLKDSYGRYYEEDGKRYNISMSGIYTINDEGKREYDKSTGKYRNLSSYHMNSDEYERGFIVNDYNKGCESGNQLGIYYDSNRDNMYVAYVTEGAKKAIISNEYLRAPVINVTGVNNWSKLVKGKVGTRAIDILKERGVRMFVVAYDADKKTNDAVLEAEKNAIAALKEEGFAIGVAEWDSYYGKGMDDLLLGGHRPNFVTI